MIPANRQTKHSRCVYGPAYVHNMDVLKVVDAREVIRKGY